MITYSCSTVQSTFFTAPFKSLVGDEGGGGEGGGKDTVPLPTVVPLLLPLVTCTGDTGLIHRLDLSLSPSSSRL